MKIGKWVVTAIRTGGWKAIHPDGSIVRLALFSDIEAHCKGYWNG